VLSKLFSCQIFFAQKDFHFPKYQKNTWREKIKKVSKKGWPIVKYRTLFAYFANIGIFKN
jgi:hypothetical protein